MPRPSPNPSFSSMLFSASHSGCPMSLSRSELSSSFSKQSLSGPSTPTPRSKYCKWTKKHFLHISELHGNIAD